MRAIKNFPEAVLIASNVGAVKLDFDTAQVEPYFCIRVRFSDVEVNRVCYTGNMRFFDYGRGKGFELGKENIRNDTSQENCKRFYDMRRREQLCVPDQKISDAAFKSLLNDLLQAVLEWVDENPGVIRGVRMTIANNKIARLEKERAEAEKVFKAVDAALKTAMHEEDSLLGTGVNELSATG